MENDESREYEISFLGRDESGAGAVSQALASHGAEITLEGPVERIELAYKIRGMIAAHFGWFHFRALPEAVAKIEEALRTNSAVIRTLVVTPPVVRREPRTGEGKPRLRPYAPAEREHAPPLPTPLSNEALERKIEEILQ